MSSNWQKCSNCACLVVTRNPMTTKLIGLCPLLAVSNTSLKAGAIGILLGAIMIASGSIAAVLRNCVSWRLKPMYHALITAFSTAIVVAIARIEHSEVIAGLGVYPALIASNCLVLSFVQEIAERNSLTRTLRQGAQDIAALIVFIVLFGTVREFVSYGTLFVETPLAARSLPMMASAPGALLLLALVLAAANALDQRAGPAIVGSVTPMTSSVGEQKTSTDTDQKHDKNF